MPVIVSNQQKRIPMEKYLSSREVAELIPGMTEALLGQMRFRGDSIPYVRVSPRKIVYRLWAAA